MYATCRHIMSSGLRCQSPAMRGSAFCYYHGRRIPPARKGSSTEHRVEMPATLDRNGITHAVTHVLQGLASGRISARRASILLLGLQMAVDHPAHCAPAPPGPAPNLPPDELPFSAEPSDDEAVSLINALAEKLGLGSPDISPPQSGPIA